MSSPSSTVTETGLPDGSWSVDPARSELRFSARGMFGLAAVKGRFTRAEGELTVAGDEAHGELRLDAASLDTGNARRDTHLRSADFFDAEHHPTVHFVLLGTTLGASGLEITGELRIRDNRLRVTAPLTVEPGPGRDELRLRTATDVDRAAAGVGWSKLGMIKGPAKLSGEVVMMATPAAAGA